MSPSEMPSTERPSVLRDGTWLAAIAVWVVGAVALAIFMLLIV